MLFSCNFEREFEDKTKSDKETTVHYYKFNQTLSNIFLIMEVIYCLICMIIFLLIIYWNHEAHTDIILGKDAQYESDEENEKMSHEEFMEELRLQKIRQLELEKFDHQISVMNPDFIGSSLVKDKSIISNDVFGKQLN